MAYTKANWKNKEDPTFNSATDPAINADNLNRIETGISDSHDHMDDSDIHFSAAERIKLEGIEEEAQVNLTAAEMLAAIMSVDGPESGLDADTLDGFHASAFVLASEISNYLNKLTDTLDDIPDGTAYVKSRNNFTDELLLKLEGIESGATVNQTDFDNYSETLSFEDNDWILLQSTTDGTMKKIRAGNLLR